MIAVCITSVFDSMVPMAKFDIRNSWISRKVPATCVTAAPAQWPRYSRSMTGATSPSIRTTTQR